MCESRDVNHNDEVVASGGGSNMSVSLRTTHFRTDLAFINSPLFSRLLLCSPNQEFLTVRASLLEAGS
jgi:hypothetical protein